MRRSNSGFLSNVICSSVFPYVTECKSIVLPNITQLMFDPFNKENSVMHVYHFAKYFT
jgi:hypothetical protein